MFGKVLNTPPDFSGVYITSVAKYLEAIAYNCSAEWLEWEISKKAQENTSGKAHHK